MYQVSDARSKRESLGGKKFSLSYHLLLDWSLRTSSRLVNALGGHYVLKLGFMWTFPRNLNVTVKLKYELIFFKC